MDGQTFQNWKIENFSCWNKEVHAKCIKSPTLFRSSCKSMELYPRGISGIDDRLVVRFCDIRKGFFGGELSFIGSDGSIICTVQVNRVNTKNVLDSPLGPKYEDVIALIRAKEAEDQLTLQFVPPSGKIFEQRMCTNIDVLKMSLEIDKNFIESVKLDKSDTVLFSSYEGDVCIYLKIALENEGMQLILEPHNVGEKAVLVESCMILLSNNDTLVRYENNINVFRGEKPWTFSDSLKINEVVDKGNTLTICLKIVKGDLNKRYNHLLYRSKGVSIVQNTNVEEKSSICLKYFSSKQTDGDSMKKLENSVSALSKELMCLFQDQDFSDLQLKCGTVSFPVHKAILSTRSPVFKRMLSNDMREAGSGSVDIADLDAPTLARLLGFLYSGSVEQLQGESALKLYYAADKYQVPTLKRECVDFLRASVSVSNVCDILSLADHHQDNELISAARDFILNNLNEVSRSDEWRCFMKSQPLLAVQTMTDITAKVFVVKKGDPQ